MTAFDLFSERFRLRVIGRQHPELALSFNAVRYKACMVNGKNYGKKFTLRQIHERAIGKIHGSIPKRDIKPYTCRASKVRTCQVRVAKIRSL